MFGSSLRGVARRGAYTMAAQQNMAAVVRPSSGSRLDEVDMRSLALKAMEKIGYHAISLSGGVSYRRDAHGNLFCETLLTESVLDDVLGTSIQELLLAHSNDACLSDVSTIRRVDANRIVLSVKAEDQDQPASTVSLLAKELSFMSLLTKSNTAPVDQKYPGQLASPFETPRLPVP